MTPFGSIEFTIEELLSEVRIRRLRHPGWIEQIVAPVLVPLLVLIGWYGQFPSLIVAASFLTMSLIYGWAWKHSSTLRVLPDRLIASAYLWNKWEGALSDLHTIQWRSGAVFDENSGPSGLYVSCRGRSRCVLPHVSEEQARIAMHAILRKFPNYPMSASHLPSNSSAS